MRQKLTTSGIGVLFGLLAMLAAAPMAWAQSSRHPAPPASRPLADRELTVANRASLPATELYVSPNDASDWGDERLAGAVVAPGKSFRIRLGRIRACLFDIQFVYRDGSREELHDLDVCRTRQVAFDGSSAIGVPVGPPHSVVLVNNENRPIQQVFLSEAEAAQWGEDRVTSRGFSVGGRLELTVLGGCAVDLRVIFDNRAAEERRGLDICATPALSIEPGWTTADAPPVPRKPIPIEGTTPAPPPPSAEPGETTLAVANNTGADVAELYLYPEGRSDQGGDLLGNGVLRDGATKPVTLARGGMCRFSAHLVFAGHVADRELKGLDACAAEGITLGR